MSLNFDDQATLFNFVVKQGNGVKGLVDSGLSCVSLPFVQPLCERIATPNAPTCEANYKYQPIDLSLLDGPRHNNVTKRIVEAAETLGFFQYRWCTMVFRRSCLNGKNLRLMHEFFAQPREKKALYQQEVSPSKLVTYGTSFFPEKERAIEWKDYISMSYTNDHDALQHWRPPCREVALDFLKSTKKMVRRVVDVLMENLGVKLEQEIMNGLLRTKMVGMNYYPTCPNPELTVGVGRHSDMGMLTVLLQDDIGGLYVKQNDDNNWTEIPPLHGALVINVGDTLQILSNGKYKSAEHRVRTTSVRSRVSVPVFTSPDPSVKVAPLPELVKRDGLARYKEFLFQDYRNNIFGHPLDGKKSLDFARAD